MKEKKYSKEEAADKLAKSMYKMMEKALKEKKRKTVIEDVLDPDNEAEVDQDALPASKPNVLWKKDDKKRGLNKLKSFIKQRKK